MSDNQKQLVHSVAIIMLIPLLSALMEVGYKLFLVPTMMPISMELQQLSRTLIFGVPSVLLIYYGYTTGNKVVATLCGVLLFPLNSIYAEILFELFDSEFIMAGLNYWLRWETIIDFTPFTLICGLMGYFSSIRTKTSLLAGVILGILLLSILLLID